MTILKLVFLAAVCLALANGACAVSVTIYNGTIELETNKWNVSLYVRQFDASTQKWERVSTFSWKYWISHVAEYWDKDLANCGCSPYNYTIANYESTTREVTRWEIFPNGANATSVDRIVEFPNGARFIQTISTFDEPTFKDVNGWKLELTPNTVKIVSRVENWPYTTPDPARPSNSVGNRKILIRGYTETVVLPRTDSSIFTFPDTLPFYVTKTRSLTEPVNPASIPAQRIALYDLVFRHRSFDLTIGFLQNSTMCADNTDASCTWIDIDQARLATGTEAEVQRRLLDQIDISRYDNEQLFKLQTDLFIGMVAGANPNVEWDPNLDFLFGNDFQTTIGGSTNGNTQSGPSSTVDFAAGGDKIALYVAIPVAVVVIGVVIAGIILYRRRRTNESRIRVQTLMKRHTQNMSESPAAPATNTAVVASQETQQPSSPRAWAAPSKPSEVRNTWEQE